MSPGSGVKTRHRSVGALTQTHVARVKGARVLCGRRVGRVLKEDPGTCDAPRADDERERGRRGRQGPKGYVKKKREMNRPRKVDVSGAIDVARHPRVATLELLLTRHPFERHPRAQKSLLPLFVPPSSCLSRCLAPTEASMSRLLQFSRLEHWRMQRDKNRRILRFQLTNVSV